MSPVCAASYGGAVEPRVELNCSEGILREVREPEQSLERTSPIRQAETNLRLCCSACEGASPWMQGLCSETRSNCRNSLGGWSVVLVKRPACCHTVGGVSLILRRIVQAAGSR